MNPAPVVLDDVAASSGHIGRRAALATDGPGLLIQLVPDRVPRNDQFVAPPTPARTVADEPATEHESVTAFGYPNARLARRFTMQMVSTQLRHRNVDSALRWAAHYRRGESDTEAGVRKSLGEINGTPSTIDSPPLLGCVAKILVEDIEVGSARRSDVHETLHLVMEHLKEVADDHGRPLGTMRVLNGDQVAVAELVHAEGFDTCVGQN